MRNVYDRREQMIAETSAFLTWAFESGADLPRIPRRRVSDGGFAELMRTDGAKKLVTKWWGRALDTLERCRY